MTMIVSEGLKDSISKLMKDILSSSEINKPSEIKRLDDLLNRVSSYTTKEAEQYVKNKQFLEAAKLYYLLSKVTTVAGFSQDEETSEVMSSSSASWLSYVDTLLYNAVYAYSRRAIKCTNNGDYKKATEYKNKANDLEYNVKNGIINNKLEEEAAQFLEPIFQEKKVEVQAETNHSEKIFQRVSRLLSKKWEEQETITPEQISITHDYRPSKKWKERYDWSVYLVTKNDSVINQIKNVIYTLHPTFSQPVLEINDPSDGFKLDSTSWCEFEIKADVLLKKNRNVITKYHWLDFGGKR
jgi:transcription initiation factor IIF auxiliary subunit